MLLGDSSYALYLTHTIAMAIFARYQTGNTWFDPKTNITAMALVVVACVIIGIAAHIFIEKPTLRFFNSRLLRRNRQPEIIASVQ